MKFGDVARVVFIDCSKLFLCSSACGQVDARQPFIITGSAAVEKLFENEQFHNTMKRFAGQYEIAVPAGESRVNAPLPDKNNYDLVSRDGRDGVGGIWNGSPERGGDGPGKGVR